MPKFAVELECNAFKNGVHTVKDASGLFEAILKPTDSMADLIPQVIAAVPKDANCSVHTIIKGLHAVERWGIVGTPDGPKNGLDNVEFKKHKIKGSEIPSYLKQLNNVLF